jgi:hypothetical protein
MRLYSHSERVAATVDGAPPGPAGRLFIVEPGVVTKVPDEAGRFILAHLAYTGAVKVNEIESETGVQFDKEQAIEDSLHALEEQDQVRFQTYIQNMVKDYVERNRPVPPPSESILRLIERRGYDLKKFGIVPIGWEAPDKDERVAQLESENATLKAAMADLNSKLDVLLQQQAENLAASGSTGAVKGKRKSAEE